MIHNRKCTERRLNVDETRASVDGAPDLAHRSVEPRSNFHYLELLNVHCGVKVREVAQLPAPHSNAVASGGNRNRDVVLGSRTS